MGFIDYTSIASGVSIGTLYLRLGNLDQLAGKDTFMSVGLFLESEGNGDQLSLRNDEVMFDFGSALETGMAATGVATEKDSFFCFLGFSSCWFPARKLPTTTWFRNNQK